MQIAQIIKKPLKKSSFQQKDAQQREQNEKVQKQKARQYYQAVCQKQCIQNIQILLEAQIQLQLGNQLSSNSCNQTLTQVFGTQLRQCLCQINMQKRKIQRVKEQQVYGEFIQNSIHKIMELNEKITKIKEFYLHCKYLRKSSTQLEENIEKYFQYAKKDSNLVSQLQIYLNNAFISDIIFKEYLKTYNVNIFTSDLIVHYFELNRNGILKSSMEKIFQAERIPQLILLEKKNIVFKQLYDINEKYTEMQDEMKNSYIMNVIQIVYKYRCIQQFNSETQQQKESTKNKKEDMFQQYNEVISEKLQNLSYLINKMTLMGNNLLQNVDSNQIPILVNQYEGNFDNLSKYLQFNERNCRNPQKLHQKYKQFLASIFKNQNNKQQYKQSLRAFFEQNLTFQCLNQNNQPQKFTEEPKFQFLKHKIIKTQTLTVLNRIFSTFNMLSYLMEQINQNSGKQIQYSFYQFDKHILSEFRGSFIKKIIQDGTTNQLSKKSIKNNYHSPSHKAHFNVFIENDDFGNWVILSGTQKLIYPSAVNALSEILNYILEVATLLQKKFLYSEELMLQILSLKAQQISKIGEIIFNIYNLVKSKQVNCYHLLKQYLKIMFKSLFDYQLQWISNIDLSVEQNILFKNQLSEIQNMKQINTKDEIDIELEKNYIDQRKRLSSQITQTRVTKFLTFYAQKTRKADFLSQIIYQLDSNYQIYQVLEELLRCQEHHYRTFYFEDNSQFYETVLYEIIQMRNHIKLDHYYTLPRLHQTFGFFTSKALSFGDILNKLAQHSTTYIKIGQLLLFFKTQLKLKRLIFKGQLYWLSYKNSIQNGKDKVFKDFVEEQAKNILCLSEQSIEYFLQNINQFSKRVSFFQQQIQRFKYFQILSGKAALSKTRIKNIENYLNGLSHRQLNQFSRYACYFNPMTSILKEQINTEQLFSDMKMSIQLNNKIRFQDISRNIYLIEEKQKLGEWLFYIKCFGFDFTYHDCYNIFVSQKEKSYLNSEDTLKLLVNRQKGSILKHYDQILYQDKKNIHLAISFYRTLILVSLLQIKDQLPDQNDCLIIQELLRNMSPFINYIKQIEKVKNIFKKGQEEEISNFDVQILFKLKNFILKLKQSLNKNILTSQISNFQDNAKQNICLIAKLTRYSQKRMVQKIQTIHHEIIQKQCTNNKKILKQLNCLNNKIINYFINLCIKSQQQNSRKQIIKLSLDQNLEDILKLIQLKISQKISILTLNKTSLYQKKQQLYLFDSLSGFKVKYDNQERFGSSIRTKQIMRRNDRKIIKKGLFSPVRSAHKAQNNIMQSIQKRVGIQMIKQSMSLRKVISKLQLEDKKMRDEIAWQTSKLQHNVIKKIHAFITESNIDQQQSYINFKYTVNLETIKGMQNVIKEQTQLALKTRQQKMNKQYTKEQLRNHQNQTNQNKQQKGSDFFLTNPNQKQIDDDESRLGYQNSRMLNANIDSIFNHLKKIRVFAAWKKIHRNMDLTNLQWNNFNKNVANILHNQENIKKVEHINQKRNQCFKQNILCSLLKEENKILSQKIRNTKIQNLTKTLQEYRKKIICQKQTE